VKRFVVSILVPLAFASAQDTVRVMTYNLLAYGDGTRDQYFRRVIHSARPDILVVQEVDSLHAVPAFLYNVLNSEQPDEYSVGILYDGPDSDNALFFRTASFSFLENNPIRTALRDLNEFVLLHPATRRVIRIFSVHLNAGIGDSLKRAEEIDSLRAYTNRFPEGTDFIIVGDFNLYSSFELGYRKLTTVTTPAGGHAVDPLSLSGAWNTAAYAGFHTQSTRVRAFGGGATGGLDDRFDMILLSQSVSEPGGISLVQGSYRAWGNDGLHYNDSINRLPNAAVADSVAQALHEASDHLPVICDLIFDASLTVKSQPEQSAKATIGMFNIFPHPLSAASRGQIRFSVSQESHVRIRVYNVLGQLIQMLADRDYTAGIHDVAWVARPATGVYFLEMVAAGQREIRKIAIVP
jgi:hypothetical protein